jgi:amicyanin
MNKITAVIIGIIVLGILIGFAVTRQPSSTTTSATASPSTSTSATATSSASASPDQSATTVTITSSSFAPASITVKKGTTVTWKNEDSFDHDVTADIASNNAPASNAFGLNQTYSFTFQQAGTYSYHCSIHPFMKGTVIVTE